MADQDTYPKTITFGDVSITEFGYRLGDNPACSSGAPVQIAWVNKEDSEAVTVDLDMYEYCKKSKTSSKMSRKRRMKELQMDVPTRAQILLQAGYSLDEIANATLKVEQIQKQRQESISHNPPPGWETMSNVLEATGKLPKGILTATGNVVSATGGLLLGGVKNIVKPRNLGARSA